VSDVNLDLFAIRPGDLERPRFRPPGPRARAVLTPADLARGAEVGREWFDYQQSERLPDRFDTPNPLEQYVHGCQCEVAFSLMTGIPWRPQCPPPPRSVPDFPPDYAVRGANRHDYRLIVRESDYLRAPDHRFVFVTLTGANALAHGWIYGREAPSLGDFWDANNKGRPAWFIEQRRLRPLTDLREFAHHFERT
jgi:hypothetical protein